MPPGANVPGGKVLDLRQQLVQLRGEHGRTEQRPRLLLQLQLRPPASPRDGGGGPETQHGGCRREGHAEALRPPQLLSATKLLRLLPDLELGKKQYNTFSY